LELNGSIVKVSIRKVQGSSFQKQAKGQYLLPKDLLTAGAQHMLPQQYAVTTESLLTMTSSDASLF
jgi:hypothetical protein